MKISPYLESLLIKWGRASFNKKPWHSVCPSFKPYADRTTRAAIYSDNEEELEKLGAAITKLADPLRTAIKVKYKYRIRTDKARVKAGGFLSKSDYYANLKEAIKLLEKVVVSG